jgi:MFS family permease
MLVAGVGFALVSYASSDQALALAGAVVGMGTATAAPALQALAIDLAGPNRRGAAMATFFAMVDLGVSVGSIAAGQIAPAVGYGGVFIAASAAPLLGLGGIAFLIRSRLSYPSHL